MIVARGGRTQLLVSNKEAGNGKYEMSGDGAVAKQAHKGSCSGHHLDSTMDIYSVNKLVPLVHKATVPKLMIVAQVIDRITGLAVA